MKSVYSYIGLLFCALLLLGTTSLQAQQQYSLAQRSVQDCPFYVPNAFTPNGDDINDVFYINYGEDCTITDFEMTIFDRWGRVVHTSESISKEQAWDGTFEGRELKQGVYMYKIQLKMASLNNRDKPKLIQRQGTVVLLR